MKFRALHVVCICTLAATWIACGAGHPTIRTINVAPQTATSTVSPPSDVQYTATATFTDNTSRELNLADGLSWSSSNTAVATVSTNGSVTCIAPGQVTITATAPADLNLTVNNGVNNTSPNVTGSASLTCNAM